MSLPDDELAEYRARAEMLTDDDLDQIEEASRLEFGLPHDTLRLVAALREARDERDALRKDLASWQSSHAFVEEERDQAREQRDAYRRADVIAKATPCTCSAQRARAEKAEAQVQAVRALLGQKDGVFPKATLADVRAALDGAQP